MDDTDAPTGRRPYGRRPPTARWDPARYALPDEERRANVLDALDRHGLVLDPFDDPEDDDDQDDEDEDDA